MKKIATIASLLVLAGCTHHSSSHAAATTASHSPTGYVSGDDNGSAGSMSGTDRENTAGADATTHDTTATAGASATGAVSGDKDLLQQVVDANRMDIDMSRLAKSSAKMASVKAFAQKAINDHDVFGDKLKPFAEAQGIDTSSIKGSPDVQGSTAPAKSQGATGDMSSSDMSTRMQNLATLHGAAFDKEYVSMMIDGHEHMLKVIDELSGVTADSKLKSTLTAIRAVVKTHLSTAEELQHAIGGPEKQNTRGTDDSTTH